MFMSIFNLCLPSCRIVLKLYPQDPGTPFVVYVQINASDNEQTISQIKYGENN